MKVELEFLGVLARIAGSRSVKIEVADNVTVRIYYRWLEGCNAEWRSI